MKTRITLKIGVDILREARELAAEEGTSISALVARQLQQVVRERRGYSGARRRALARLRNGDSTSVGSLPFLATNSNE